MLLVALADIVGARKLEGGIGLVLDAMSFGDPGETMRGIRHSLEAAADRHWDRLATICASRCTSDRAGARYWAVQELGVLREPATLPTILAMFDDGFEIAREAFGSAGMLLQQHEDLRPRVIAALRRARELRPDLRQEASETIATIQQHQPSLVRVSDQAAEQALGRAIQQFRDDRRDERPVVDAVEAFLQVCLRASEEWDGARVSDGILTSFVGFTQPRSFRLCGHVVWLPDHVVDPIDVRVDLDASWQTITRFTIKLGDAAAGLGARKYGDNSDRAALVKHWVFAFTRRES